MDDIFYCKICWMFWAINFIVPLIPLFIIDACEDFEFSMTTQIILIGFILLCSVGFIIFSLVFFKAMCGFSLLLAEKIYFLVCTTKGNALEEKILRLSRTQMNRYIHLLRHKNAGAIATQFALLYVKPSKEVI